MTEAMIVGAVVVGWIGCGAVAHAVSLHDFDRQFRSLWPEARRSQVLFSVVTAAFCGPAYLAGVLMFSRRPYGLRWF